MTIYVDRFRVPADITDTRTGRTYSSRWSHLISDDLDPTELHAFAARLGMKREWFQPGNTLGTKDGLDRVGDHYDLTDPKRRKAITLGAVEIDGHEMGEILIAKRKKARAMRYMGGKARVGKEIANFIAARHPNATRYIEPFVGAAWVLVHAAPNYPHVLAGDANYDLVVLYEALSIGWTPPESLSREEYKDLRNAEPSALRTFAGFGMSFGGRWFEGYAASRGDDYCGAARRGLIKKLPALAGIRVEHRSYDEWSPSAGDVVYCDPPYANTKWYSGMPAFSTEAFWKTCREWATDGAHVYVSEYDAPDGLLPVWSKSTNGSLHRDRNDDPVTERLYYIPPQQKEAQAMTTPIDQSDRSDYFGEPVTMTTSGDGVQMKGDRYILPTNDGLDGKWHPHTRVTAISNALPSTYGLSVWASDRVAWAMAQRPDLCALLASVPLTDVETIREVRAKAEVVSATDEGANLGTATHNILGRYSSGEPIETLHRMFWPDIKAFQALLDEHGLTVLPGLIERVVRMRDYDIAGRLDYIMQERDGTLVVVDVKTKGDPEKVHEIATQLAPYANADEMFDSVTGRYVPMPPVRRDYALMIHIHPGSGVATIKKINIRLGLWSVEVAKNALAYSRMTHLAVPYTPPGPVKPADATTVRRVYDAGTVYQPQQQPAHPVRQSNASVTGLVFDGMVGNGQQPVRPCADCGALDGGPTGNHAATCSQRPDSPRASSTYDPTAHSAQIAAQIAAGGVVIPNGQPAAAAPAPQSTTSGPTASPVSAPNPATYGAPAGVTPPPAYQPQTVVPRAEAVLVTTGEGGIEAEAHEIVAVFKNKSKAVMQAYARRYGITDLNHHKIHIATSIATVRADRRKAGLDAEPAGDETTPAATKPRPQTLAEAGFGNPPASPPGEPVVPDIDASEQAVLADISRAQTVQDIGRIWQLWTDAHGGPESWRGNVQAAADAKVAEIQVAGPPAGGVDEPPF